MTLGHNSTKEDNPELKKIRVSYFFKRNPSMKFQNPILKRVRTAGQTDRQTDALTFGFLLGTYNVRKSSQERVSTQQFPENFNRINLIFSLLAPFICK